MFQSSVLVRICHLGPDRRIQDPSPNCYRNCSSETCPRQQGSSWPPSSAAPIIEGVGQSETPEPCRFGWQGALSQLPRVRPEDLRAGRAPPGHGLASPDLRPQGQPPSRADLRGSTHTEEQPAVSPVSSLITKVSRSHLEKPGERQASGSVRRAWGGVTGAPHVWCGAWPTSYSCQT